MPQPQTTHEVRTHSHPPSPLHLTWRGPQHLLPQGSAPPILAPNPSAPCLLCQQALWHPSPSQVTSHGSPAQLIPAPPQAP